MQAGVTAPQARGMPDTGDCMGVEHRLDVRNMEAPEPLLLVLAELESLVPGDFLRILVNRDPVLLYPLLESRDFHCARQIGTDGSHVILIWRRGDIAAEQAACAVADVDD